MRKKMEIKKTQKKERLKNGVLEIWQIAWFLQSRVIQCR